MLSTHFTCWLTFGSWFFRQRERSRPRWAAPEWILAQHASKDRQSPQLTCLTCCWRKRLTSCLREAPNRQHLKAKSCWLRQRDNLGFYLHLRCWKRAPGKPTLTIGQSLLICYINWWIPKFLYPMVWKQQIFWNLHPTNSSELFSCCEATSKDASFAIKVKSLDTNVRGLRGFFSATLLLKPFDVGAVACISWTNTQRKSDRILFEVSIYWSTWIE